jgi:MFS family permease
MSKTEKISTKIKWSIILLSLAGQLAWAVENQYFNLFLYNEIAPVPMYVSLLVAITAVASTVTAIFMGALSDVKGKRRIFMLIGYSLWALTTAMFPLAGYFRPVILAVTIAILFDSIMTFFGAMANDAALNAYVTDVTNTQNRGKITSLMEIMFLVATLIIYGFAGFIIEAVGYYVFFYIVGGLVALIGIPGALIAPEPEDLRPSTLGYWKTIKSTFNRTAITENKNLFLILLSTALWGIAFNVFFPFVLIYLEHFLHIEIFLASIVIFVALLISIIAAYPVGKLVDKFGRKKIAIGAIFLESISLFLFAFSELIVFVAITAAIWVFAMVSWDIASKTWVRDLLPDDKRGQFSGYFILFNVLIGMTIGPLIGGLISEAYGTSIIIEGIAGFIPPPLVFIVAAFLMLLVLIPIVKAKEFEK